MKFNLDFRIHFFEDPGLKLPQKFQSLLHTAKTCNWSFKLFELFVSLLCIYV